MRYFIGIDGGGTKTRALLVDSKGNVRGRGVAGPGNYHNVGIDVVKKNIKHAVELAWAQAKMQPQTASTAFLGMAGVKSESDQLQIRQITESLGIAEVGQITVENDLANALSGGLAGAPGIAIIAGTGSNALGKDCVGNFRYCGGWGWLLDDEGGAVGIAIAAMKQIVRSHDGQGPATSLIPALLAYWNLQHAHELPQAIYTKPIQPEFIAQFTRLVIEHAIEGDALAKSVLLKAAKRLADQVDTLISSMEFKTQKVSVVLLGGCLENQEFYRNMVSHEITKKNPRATIKPPKFSSEEGAAFNVLNQAGIPIPKTINLSKDES